MALVEISGYVADHTRTPFTGRHARLMFRPNDANVGRGYLLAGVEAFADLSETTGYFTVQVENAPGASYTPVLDWVINPSEAPERWARHYEEWPFTVWPGANGGPVDDLIEHAPAGSVAWGFGPPTEDYPVYYDISGAKPVLWLLGKQADS